MWVSMVLLGCDAAVTAAEQEYAKESEAAYLRTCMAAAIEGVSPEQQRDACLCVLAEVRKTTPDADLAFVESHVLDQAASTCLGRLSGG